MTVEDEHELGAIICAILNKNFKVLGDMNISSEDVIIGKYLLSKYSKYYEIFKMIALRDWDDYHYKRSHGYTTTYEYRYHIGDNILFFIQHGHGYQSRLRINDDTDILFNDDTLCDLMRSLCSYVNKTVSEMDRIHQESYALNNIISHIKRKAESVSNNR